MTVESAVKRESGAGMPVPAAPGPGLSGDTRPVRIEPDLEFIRALISGGADTVKKCFQCGTCSATCTLSPDPEPFPRKEMAWALWGWKDRLVRDPDVWLCHQCQDCSVRCPRGARPGDVLAAVRQECVAHYAFPRFLARWMSRPQYVPLLLAIPIALLTLALLLRDTLAAALGFSPQPGARIIYAYSSVFPHWLLNGFFGLFSLLALLAMLVSARRFWRALEEADRMPRIRGLAASTWAALRSIATHRNFDLCTAARPRYLSHLCVLAGFVALTLVTLWVITAEYNPLIRSDFVYPFGFWNPWKMLANVGGIAVLAGCLLMAWERLREGGSMGIGAYFDWVLLADLFLVVATGFATEVLHYLRLEPHRHIAYFTHLVFVFTLLIYLPYSKLAHLVYRALAMIHADRIGRILGSAPTPGAERTGR